MRCERTRDQFLRSRRSRLRDASGAKPASFATSSGTAERLREKSAFGVCFSRFCRALIQQFSEFLKVVDDIVRARAEKKGLGKRSGDGGHAAAGGFAGDHSV